MDHTLTVSWFLLLIAAASVQGLLLSMALLVSGWRSNPSHRWLGAYVLAFTLGMIGDWLYATRAILAVPHLVLVFDWLVLWLGPFCYGYVRTLFGAPAWTRWRLLLHLLPGLLLLALLLPGIWQSGAAKRALLVEDLATPAANEPAIVFLLFAVQTLCYLVVALRCWWRHRRALEQQHSNADVLMVVWLRWLLSFNIGMWAVWQLSILFGWTWADQLNQLGFAVGVYALGYFGIREPRPATLAEADKPALAPTAAAGLDAGPDPDPDSQRAAAVVSAAPRYLKSAIDPETLQAIIDRLQALMREQQAWREPELSLSMLAQRLGVRPHELSQALNARLRQSFFDYVNGLRVADVQAQLATQPHPGPPLLQLALAAGFSSKATFNASFKRVAGVTPSAWRREVLQAAPTRPNAD